MLDGRSEAVRGNAIPTSDELIRRAVSLVPLLRKNAAEAEQLRHLPASTAVATMRHGISCA